MSRARNSAAARARRRKVLRAAKGYVGGRRKLLTVAKHTVEKGLQYAYRDRRARKREFRRLWIVRINAAVLEHGLSYSRFMNGLKRAEIDLDRTVLAELAVTDPQAFADLVSLARKHLEAAPAA